MDEIKQTVIKRRKGDNGAKKVTQGGGCKDKAEEEMKRERDN